LPPVLPLLLAVVPLLLLAGCKGSTGPKERPRVVVLPATHPTGQQLTVLALAGRPHGVSVAPTGIFYVSQIDNASVTKGELRGAGRDVLLGEAAVGTSPAHVAVNATATNAYSTDQGSGTLSIIDVAQNRRRASLQLQSGGFNLLAAPNGRHVYATTASGTLVVIATTATTESIVATLNVGGAANGLALDVANERLYVSSISAGTVTTIDTRTNAIVRTTTVGGRPQRLALTRDGTTLYIANEDLGLQRLTLATGGLMAFSGVARGVVGLALTPDGQQLYVTNPPAGRVEVVNVVSGAVVQTITAAIRPRNVTFDVRGTTALITDEANQLVLVR